MSRLADFLSQPYPYYYRGSALGLVVLVAFSMTFAFGYFFEPFAVAFDEHKFSYFWICVFHALVPAAVVGLLATIPGRWTQDEHWTVGKEVLLISLALLLVGIGQFLIRDIIYDNPNNWSWGYLYEEIRNTFLIGTLFVIIIVSLNFNRLNSQHVKRALSVKALGHEHKATVEIKAKVKKDDMTLEVDQLLFAKADGNYVTLILDGDVVKNELKRITLKELETMLAPYPTIVRTHRSDRKSVV